MLVLKRERAHVCDSCKLGREHVNHPLFACHHLTVAVGGRLPPCHWQQQTTPAVGKQPPASCALNRIPCLCHLPPLPLTLPSRGGVSQFDLEGVVGFLESVRDTAAVRDVLRYLLQQLHARRKLRAEFTEAVYDVEGGPAVFLSLLSR